MCPTTPTQPAKKQKTSHHTAAPPSPGGLATFDDDDTFISDSDDNMEMKEVEDIRFDLESVPVDEALMAKRVYVTGFNPSVCADQLEGDFGRFAKNVKNSMIRVRRMDSHTQRILTVQFQQVRDTWKCTGTQCRSDVSVWNGKCDKCGRKRVYWPSNVKIGAESWLCCL
ncbi:hypothetical protein BBJ28_00011082 [Nothophytophthora sp. Chile5]|nr:hypothetical protein BBJ28_00011082 [Nothophytophthora sp. Chile5]